MSKENEKITVRIIEETKPCWYKTGEIHEVNNYVTFIFKNEANFEKGDGMYGIKVSDCEILTPDEPIEEYTLKQIEDKLGCKIKIIAD